MAGIRARWWIGGMLFAVLAVAAAGCPNPVKREAYNVFPGQPGYDKRVADFNLDPEHAHQRAMAAARRDGRPEYVSLRPTVIHGRKYVFSIPVGDGANLKGYHVDGDTAEVLFYKKDEVVKLKKK